MKPPIQRIALLCALASTTFISCNSGTGEKAKTDSTPPAAAAAPAPLREELVIKHKVANYAKWKPMFDADVANRKAAGLVDHIIGRGDEDSNMVIIIMYMDDAAKAKAMVGDPKLKEVMQKAGVVGAPEIDFVHRVENDTTPTSQTARMMVKLKVKDFEAWKTLFDSDKPVRVANGSQDRMVGHNVDDNHMVTIISVVNDAAKSRARMSSRELADKMKASGVEGTPSFFAYHIVEKKN
jgi:hypothetical protein